VTTSPAATSPADCEPAWELARRVVEDLPDISEWNDMTDDVCACCDFGNHTEPCTCGGQDCCHPENHRRQPTEAVSKRTVVDAVTGRRSPQVGSDANPCP